MKRLHSLFCVLTITVIALQIANSSEENINFLIKKNDSPIAHDVEYSEYWDVCASWSGTGSHSDYKRNEAVVDFRSYAKSFDEFIEKYPHFTVETNGRAVSESTVGDVGRGKFGTIRFKTNMFDSDKYNYKNLVESYSFKFWYTVSIKIGLGFKKSGNQLYLNPFIDGWIYSGGAYERCLSFGLSVYTITFYPKTD